VNPPLVVKFGGDALATPERIAAAARRVALRRRSQPVVAVASARRGITDHLLGLVEQVREAVPTPGAPLPDALAASDRAVASGELVAAALLAVALGQLGLRAVVLDAREAGLHTTGTAGGASLTTLRPARLERLLARGLTPVVTGFQGWHRGRLTTLGRGGSDITAVALAGALGADGCELVKDPGALHTADPRLVADARPIERATHHFVTEIALAGARIIHHLAASRAEHDGVRLRFTSLHGDGEPATDVGHAVVEDGPTYAVVLGTGYRGVRPAAGDPPDVMTVSLVTGAADHGTHRAAAAAVLGTAGTGALVLRRVHRPHAVGFLVPAAEGSRLLRMLHAVASVAPAPAEPEGRVHACHG
jgi:aspartokinase